VVNAVLLKPLTYPDADRIVRFFNTDHDQPAGEGASVTKFHIWQEQTNAFEDVAAYDFGGPGMNVTEGAFPEQVKGIHVTANYFRLFGARAIHGRTFTAEEDLPNGGHVVVISYALWRKRFAEDPNAVGKTLSLGGVAHTIVGVIGPDFVTDPPADLWLPYQFDPNSNDQAHYFLASGRLKPGVSLNQAKAQLKVAWAQFAKKYPEADKNGGFSAALLRDAIVEDVRSSLLVLEIAVAFVLLIACANVANLLLIRAAGRKREIAIRAALGAGRRRIVRQLLTESVLLSLAGGILGLVLGMVGVHALLSLNPGDIPRIGENGAAVGVDWRVVVFTVLISALTGIVFGMIPALDISRGVLASNLKEGSARTGSSFRQNKMRALLVVVEMSLALVLLVGSGLLIRTFIALRSVNPGFDAHNILIMNMSLTGPRFEKSSGVAQMAYDARRRLDALPGVVESASTCCIPLQGGFGLPFTIVGHAQDEHDGAGWASVSAGYFEVFKIPLVRGRFFNDQDSGGATGTVIINQAMARKFWPKADPLNTQIVIGHGVGPEFEEGPRVIVGIVGDVHNGELKRDPNPTMYIPVGQVTDGITALNARIGPIAWIVRTRIAPYSLRTAVEHELQQASGGLPVGDVRSMDEVVIRSTARADFNMLLLTIFGCSALLLAAIGIYALMAYSVQQRTQEIGIRMALGAERAIVQNMVISQGMRVTLIGVAIGIAAAFGLTRLLESFLFGVKTWDPMAFTAVPLLLSAVALLAVWLPARRATRIDPADALRYE